MLYDCVKTSTVLRSTSVTAFNERRFSASAQNFEEYPEHRTNFFLLLQAVNSHCFDAFLAIDPAQFKLVLDAIIWAFKHTMRNVADTGACGAYWVRCLSAVRRLNVLCGVGPQNSGSIRIASVDS